LDEKKRATVWVDQVLAVLSERCEKLAEKGAEESVEEELVELSADCEGLYLRVKEGSDLILRAEAQSVPSIKAAEDVTILARSDLSTALKLSSEDVLGEEGQNPCDYLEEAHVQHGGALAALDRGEVEAARGFLDEVDALVKHAEGLVNETKEVYREYPNASEILWSRRGTLSDQVERAGKRVEKMRKRYAPRALFLDPVEVSDESYVEAPSSLEANLKMILGCLDQAKGCFEKGQLLQAWKLIEDGRSTALSGETLCQEVEARKQELEQLEVDNERVLSYRDKDRADMEASISDRRVMAQTVTRFDELVLKLKEARAEVDAGDGVRNPFMVAEQLKEIAALIELLRMAVSDDLEQYAAVVKLNSLVGASLTDAKNLAHTADTDQIPNSRDTEQCLNAIEKAKGDLDEVERRMSIDHEDWRELQGDLRGTHLRLSEAVVDLKRELELAREAVRALQNATKEVRRAARWSGSYGVRISGRPGGRSLLTANQVMMKGEYHPAMEWAGRARSEARSAIAEAEAKEASRRRAAEAEERRRMQRSRMSSSVSSSSFSGFSSSSSSTSSSVGRSSFSSGSGVGRSGW